MYVWMFAGQSKKKNNQLTKIVHSLWNLAVTKALVEALLAAASDDGLGPPGAPVPASFALRAGRYSNQSVFWGDASTSFILSKYTAKSGYLLKIIARTAAF